MFDRVPTAAVSAAERRELFIKTLSPKRRSACRWVSLPDGSSALMTRGERKQLARKATGATILAQQAQPDLLPAKFLSAAGRQRLRESIAAKAAVTETPKPKRASKKKVAA